MAKAAYVERLLEVLSANMPFSRKKASYEACGNDLREDDRRLLRDRLFSFSMEALRAANLALRRWMRWCSRSNPPIPPFPPVPVHVALFLQAVAEGKEASLLVKRRNDAEGASAADGVRGGVRFTQLHL